MIASDEAWPERGDQRQAESPPPVPGSTLNASMTSARVALDGTITTSARRTDKRIMWRRY